ncbi:MAG: hypothetical protein PVSMB4_07330 [Ktedonobacterales bacterium]
MAVAQMAVAQMAVAQMAVAQMAVAQMAAAQMAAGAVRLPVRTGPPIGAVCFRACCGAHRLLRTGPRTGGVARASRAVVRVVGAGGLWPV